MRVDWATLIMVLLVVVLTRMLRGTLFLRSTGGTQVGAIVKSPAEPMVVYGNPIDEYLAKYHPDARR